MLSVRLVLPLLALVALPAVAGAATPRSRAILEDHRHYTRGNDWHVQLEVNRASSRIASVVVYSQRCEATGFTQGVAVGEGGTFVLDRALSDKTGRFALDGKFVNPDRARGTWQITKGDCTDGGEFRAQDASGHFLLGNPYEYPPVRINGESETAKRLRGLLRSTLRWSTLFNTRAKARKRGYVSSRRAGCPGMNHARKHGTSMWGSVLDPQRPQSLVYWCGAHGGWTLAGVMYRAPGRSRPPTYGNLLQWHKHGATKTATWMAHIWMTRDATSAFATCVPFRAFEAQQLLTYHDYLAAPGNEPCSDTSS